MKVCNQTLFSAWSKRPGADGRLSYDDFGEITVSAFSLACFPGVKFPVDPSDNRAVHDFLLQLRLTHPILQSMRDARAFTSGGNVFVLLHGTVGFQVPDDALSRRLSIALSVTQRRGFLLTWFFAAPHDSELKDLLAGKILFRGGPPAQDAGTVRPGGGESISADAPPAPQEAMPGPPELSSGSSAAHDPAADAANSSAAGSPEQPNAPAAPPSATPGSSPTAATVPDPQDTVPPR
jgi:hypothetical protein